MDDQDAPAMIVGISRREPAAWKKAVAGASTGVVCAAVLCPLDVARTRLQVQGALGNTKLPVYSGIFRTLARIQREEGTAGLFRGFQPAVLTVPVFWALYFPLYDHLKLAFSTEADTRSAGVHMASAICAGFAINLLTNPLWIVRTRLQTQALHGERGEGMAVVLRGIVRDEGWLALYKGLGASTLGLSHIAIQFPVYEWIKRTLGEYAREPPRRPPLGAQLSRRGLHPRASSGAGTLSARESESRGVADEPQPVWAVLVASSVSKLLASLATYPHELVRARLQDQRTPSGATGVRYAGIIDVVRQTVRAEGVGALWHGFSVNLVRAVPQSMITFGMYEWLIYNM